MGQVADFTELCLASFSRALTGLCSKPLYDEIAGSLVAAPVKGATEVHVEFVPDPTRWKSVPAVSFPITYTTKSSLGTVTLP